MLSIPVSRILPKTSALSMAVSSSIQQSILK